VDQQTYSNGGNQIALHAILNTRHVLRAKKTLAAELGSAATGFSAKFTRFTKKIPRSEKNH